jgi:hypothetical protein
MNPKFCGERQLFSIVYCVGLSAIPTSPLFFNIHHKCPSSNTLDICSPVRWRMTFHVHNDLLEFERGNTSSYSGDLALEESMYLKRERIWLWKRLCTWRWTKFGFGRGCVPEEDKIWLWKRLCTWRGTELVFGRGCVSEERKNLALEEAMYLKRDRIWLWKRQCTWRGTEFGFGGGYVPEEKSNEQWLAEFRYGEVKLGEN